VKKQKSFSLRVAVVSALAMAVLVMTGCPNGNDPGSDPGPGQVVPDPGPGQGVPVVPITVTITGIPSGHSRGMLVLQNLVTGGSVDWSEVRVEGASISFPFNAFPGTYNLRFMLFENGAFSEYFLASRSITTGANTIPFSDFTPVEQISITVTGIPNQYTGVGGRMYLTYPGTLNWMGEGSIWVSSSSATFTMRAIPGAYDVHLRFWYDNTWSLLGAYSAPSVNITAGENTIPFTAFQIFEPMTITVTGIPGRYAGGEGGIILNTPGFIDWVADGLVWPIEGSSAIFTVFAMPGTYDVALYFEFETGDGWDFVLYSVSRRNITAGANTIPFSAFSRVPQMSITVTGIPSQYVDAGNWGDVALMLPGTENGVAWGEARVRGASLTMDLFTSIWVFNTPGTYDVILSLSDGTWREYFAPSRTLTAGTNTIPFSAFTRVPSGLAETLEPSERAMPGRSRARALSPRAR